MKNKLNRLTGKHGTVCGAGVLFFTAALWPSAVHGVAVSIPNQDPEAIARGNAFVATADNPAALYYNPAGITQLPGFQAQVGLLEYFGVHVHYEGPTSSTDSKFHLLPVPQAYFSYTPESLPLSFGVGVYAPFGLQVEYPDNSPLRDSAISSKLEYITLNPVVAWKACDSFSIAVGPTLNYSKLDLKRGLASANDIFQFTGEGVSYGMTAGLLWKPAAAWSFGADYRLASTMHYNGSSYYNPGVAGFPSIASATSGDFQYPQTACVGVSFRPTEKWNLEADFNWADWHTLRTVTLNGTKNNPYFAAIGDLQFPLNWHSSYFYEFGATRYLDNGWFVSAGYFLSTQTTSATDFTPAVPDSMLHVGSIGFGRKGEHWNWAVAGQIIAGPKRVIGNDVNPSANGSYQIFAPTLSASIGYKF